MQCTALHCIRTLYVHMHMHICTYDSIWRVRRQSVCLLRHDQSQKKNSTHFLEMESKWYGCSFYCAVFVHRFVCAMCTDIFCAIFRGQLLFLQAKQNETQIETISITTIGINILDSYKNKRERTIAWFKTWIGFVFATKNLLKMHISECICHFQYRMSPIQFSSVRSERKIATQMQFLCRM